jgi:uncharacterized cupin superfamily protein
MKIIVEKKISEEKLRQLGVKSWPVWECDISTFDWHYDEKEACYFLEGDVIVETEDGNVQFGAGDYVVFPKGLSCKWKVVKPVKKHYKFG